MSGIWLPGARVAHDMSGSRGNGLFGTGNAEFYGVVLHVNQSNGDLSNFITVGNSYGPGGQNAVCPNFEVYKDGSFDQYLPLMWRPWCQAAGNDHYAAIETEGFNTESMTDAQVTTIGMILAAYATQGMALQVTDTVGGRGFGTHVMGGPAWGGHTCPGPGPRAGQRQAALNIASGLTPSGGGTPIPDPVTQIIKDGIMRVCTGYAAGGAQLVTDGALSFLPLDGSGGVDSQSASAAYLALDPNHQVVTLDANQADALRKAVLFNRSQLTKF